MSGDRKRKSDGDEKAQRKKARPSLPLPQPTIRQQSTKTKRNGGGGGSGRKKVDVVYIEDQARRSSCYSKRSSGLLKKAEELSEMTGATVCVVVVSESGRPKHFISPSSSHNLKTDIVGSTSSSKGVISFSIETTKAKK